MVCGGLSIALLYSTTQLTFSESQLQTRVRYLQSLEEEHVAGIYKHCASSEGGKRYPIIVKLSGKREQRREGGVTIGQE